MPHTYFAQVERSGGLVGGSVVHLIREDAEASLCAIPRSSLTGGGTGDQVVCASCLEWFEKRRKISGEHKAFKAD